MQVSVCPGGLASGYTYFIPQEEHLESQVVTRGYLEGRMVVGMAGRYPILLPNLVVSLPFLSYKRAVHLWMYQTTPSGMDGRTGTWGRMYQDIVCLAADVIDAYSHSMFVHV